MQVLFSPGGLAQQFQLGLVIECEYKMYIFIWMAPYIFYTTYQIPFISPVKVLKKIQHFSVGHGTS